jgi:hypothetical protein
MRGVLDAILCDKVCRVAYDRSVVFSTNETDRHDITEKILLKVALNTINITHLIIIIVIIIIIPVVYFKKFLTFILLVRKYNLNSFIMALTTLYIDNYYALI